MRTIIRRSCANRLGRPRAIFVMLIWFKLMIAFEGVHPLEGGAVRLKFRHDRRYGMPLESGLGFYCRYFGDTVLKAWRYWGIYRRLTAILKECLAAPDRWTYTDLAVSPYLRNDLETLDLYHATNGGEAALARKRRDDAIRARAMLAEGIVPSGTGD